MLEREKRGWGKRKRGAHGQDEVRPKIIFPSPQIYNTATMILIYLLGLGNWIAVKLVGRAAEISDCGGVNLHRDKLTMLLTDISPI